MVVDGDDHPAHIDAHLAGGCFENPSIRLMRHYPIYIRCLMSCRGKQLLEDSGQIRYGESEDFGALHPEAADRSCRRWSPIDIEQARSEEHTSELQSLMRISYAAFCLKQKT